MKFGVELVQARVPVLRRQRQRGAHAELRLVHGARINHRPQHVDGALVHVRDDVRDVMGVQAVRLHHRQQRIGGGVRVAAAGMPFERGFGRRPARAQAIGQARRIGTLAAACAVCNCLLPASLFGALIVLEGQFVTPWILGRRLKLNPVAILLWLMLLGWLWGPVGVVLAVPALVVVKIVCERVEGWDWLARAVE